jgi:hypothetical protein
MWTTMENLRNWVGSDNLTVDELLDLLHLALSDENGTEARIMRQDVLDYAEQDWEFENAKTD